MKHIVISTVTQRGRKKRKERKKERKKLFKKVLSSLCTNIQPSSAPVIILSNSLTILLTLPSLLSVH